MERRKAVAAAQDQPMIAVTLGHALVATEDSAYLSEAKQVPSGRRCSHSNGAPGAPLSAPFQRVPPTSRW